MRRVEQNGSDDLELAFPVGRGMRLIQPEKAMSEAAAIMGREVKKSLGTMFVAAREKRGLSIEQAASETRIRPQRLREIERDDYSQFSHPSYARMYAIDYAKYLGIPISRIRRLLPDAGVCGAEGYQYLRETPCDYMRTDLGSSSRRKRLLPKLATAAVIVLLGFGGFKLWITVRDIERLGLNRIAGGDVPQEQNAVEPISAAPESSPDPIEAKDKEAEAPEPEVPVRRAIPSDSESALLVGTALEHNDGIR